MGKKEEQVLKPGVEVTHIYDFGTSSETLIRAVAVREGRPTSSRPIALMARNSRPEENCMECGQAVTKLCLECLYEEEKWGRCVKSTRGSTPTTSMESHWI